MTAFVSQGELDRGALTDAPDAAWVDTLLQSYNDFRRNVTSVLQKGVSTGDNTVNGEKVLTLVHNVEVPCSNPLKVPIKSVMPLQCDGIVLDSTGKTTTAVYQLDTPTISWRPNPTSKDGGVLVKATFPPPAGFVDVRRNAVQSLATGGSGSPVQFDTNESGVVAVGTTITSGALSVDVTTTSGSPPTNSKIVCAAPGFVDVFAQTPIDTSAVALKFGWISKNNVSTVRWGLNGGTFTGYGMLMHSARMSVVAGDYLQAFAFQDSGGAVNILADGQDYARFQARYVAPPINTTGRVNLLFYGG